MFLDPIPDALRKQARACFKRGDALGFLGCAHPKYALRLVYFNAEAFLRRGIYEPALVQAFITSEGNNHPFSTSELVGLFTQADRARLRASGDPLPGDGPFTIYRGVAGRSSARRVRGLSWTGSCERAWWFAKRFDGVLADPAVHVVTVAADDVLLYSNERNEQEFIILPPRRRPKRVEARLT